MKIILATSGSRGDVQPMTALCLALARRGHQAVLAGPPERVQWAADLGCDYVPLGRNITRFIRRMGDPGSLMSACLFSAMLSHEVQDQFSSLPGLIRGADLVIGSSLVFALSSLAEAMGIPYRYVCFTPCLIPSVAHTFPVTPLQCRQEMANRLSWMAGLAFDRLNITRLINRNRRSLGLAPVSHALDHILGRHTLVACDRILAPVPPARSLLPLPFAATRQFYQTGYLHLDLPAPEWPELDRFIRKGTRPVFAGFGSMPPKDFKKTAPIVASAVRQTGRRLILGYPDLSSPFRQISDHVFAIRSFPHLALFPKMAAVIHHGGAGTTAAGLASGIPQVLVPHILDQFYHAQRIHFCGFGPKPVPRLCLNSRRLAASLEIALNDPGIWKRTAAAALQVRRFKAVEAAANAVDRMA